MQSFEHFRSIVQNVSFGNPEHALLTPEQCIVIDIPITIV